MQPGPHTPASNTPAKTAVGTRPDAQANQGGPGFDAHGATRDRVAHWLGRRFQLSMPGWAILLVVGALLLVALD